MERNYYTDRFLEEDFEAAVKEKEKKVQQKYTEQQLKDLYFDNAQKINKELIKAKTHLKYYKDLNTRSKRYMLTYLDQCIKGNKISMSYREKLEFKSRYVDKSGSNLGHLGFKTLVYVPFFIVAAIIVDLLLVILGIASYYYYVPFITILVTYHQIKGMLRAKKASKLLR